MCYFPIHWNDYAPYLVQRVKKKHLIISVWSWDCFCRIHLFSLPEFVMSLPHTLIYIWRLSIRFKRLSFLSRRLYTVVWHINNISSIRWTDTNPSGLGAEVERLPKSLSESLEALKEDNLFADLLGENLLVAIKGVRKVRFEYDFVMVF